MELVSQLLKDCPPLHLLLGCIAELGAEVWSEMVLSSRLALALCWVRFPKVHVLTTHEEIND